MRASLAQQIVDAAERMGKAVDQARGWVAPGWCCQPTGQPWQPCLKPACLARQQRWAYYWSVSAAHEGRQLLRLAEIVGESVGFTDGEERASVALRRTERAA